MDTYQLLPPLSDAEYDALKADIAANGVQYPIILDETGAVIDGHHRLRICQELGISPPTEVRVGLSDGQKHDLALSLNLQRRHLSQIQRRDLIRAELKRDPDRSNRAIARLIGVDHKTVAVVRDELPMHPVIEQDHALSDTEEARCRALMELRWHWTLDNSNPERVSMHEYAQGVGGSHHDIRRYAKGFELLVTKGFAPTEALMQAGLIAETEVAAEAVAEAHAQRDAGRPGA